MKKITGADAINQAAIIGAGTIYRAAVIGAGAIYRAAIIGAGTMGSGIAICFANAGIPVSLIDVNEQGLHKGLENISKVYDRQIQKGKLTLEQKQNAMQLISGHLSLSAVQDADVIIEAVFEDMNLKKSIFIEIDKYAKASALLATNTSTFDINEIAHATKRPEAVMGLHFFSPANVMPLLEVVRTEANTQATIDTAMHLAKRLQKTPVLAKVCYGFIGNRMMETYGREAERMALEGATPEKIDASLKSFGMAMGILAVYDMAGVDVGVKVHLANAHRLPPDPTYYQASQALYDAGRLGQKNGKGFYRYNAGEHQPYPDADALKIIQQRAAQLNIPQRSDHSEKEISQNEITERCIFALVNEAFNILEEGIAQTASDIDLVWTLGYGFPREKGGPLCFAEKFGLQKIYDGILHYQKTLNDENQYGALHWQPAALLERLVREKMTIAEWEKTAQ